MTTMTAYQDLMAFQRETEALAEIAGRLGWDQETMMPRCSADQRAEETAAISHVLHQRRIDPRVEDWLGQIEDDALEPEAQAQMRLIRRDFNRTRKIPPKLATEIARVTSRAQGQWAEARANEDVAAFLPVLEQVVQLRQEEGHALAEGGDAYDALLNDYEPEAKAAEIDAMFAAMRPRLVALRTAALDRPAPAPVKGDFPADVQLALARDVAVAFGYDLDCGRIDLAVHPFSSGSGRDVRITTRTNADDPFNCIYSTIHEVGHASYEQGIDPAYLLTPLGEGVSIGVHESQSRIYENQLGRSRAFTGWLFERMTERFGDLGLDGPDAFYAAANRLHNGYIRTEADEVQYNLHVMLRFDLERALISGDLKVTDLEAAWNDRFAADFGFAVDKPSNGCLQDVHWSVGLFGYFPTYSLGNVYAGCLYEALRKAVPDLDDHLARGHLTPATAWLREHVQRHGGRYTPRDLIAQASGAQPGPEPLLSYLEEKFGALYGF